MPSRLLSARIPAIKGCESRLADVAKKISQLDFLNYNIF
jgi:hypothetical protein